MGINQDLANQEKLDQQKAYIEAWKKLETLSSRSFQTLLKQ